MAAIDFYGLRWLAPMPAQCIPQVAAASRHTSLSCAAQHIQRRLHTKAVANIVAVACACTLMGPLGQRVAFEGASVRRYVTMIDRPAGTACAW